MERQTQISVLMNFNTVLYTTLSATWFLAGFGPTRLASKTEDRDSVSHSDLVDLSTVCICTVLVFPLYRM